MPEKNRVCSTCTTEKPLGEFSRDASQPGGFCYRCKGCDRERKKERRGTLQKHREREALAMAGKKRCSHCREVKGSGEFRAKPQAKDGLQSWCRACQNKASREAQRRLAPGKKAARAEAAKNRPPRPPPLSAAERTKRWQVQNPEAAKAAYRRYYQTEKGKLRHRLTSGRRRARMNGKVTPREWEAVQVAWGHRCAYCKRAVALTIEHVVPVAAGGPHVVGNIVPACKPCNDSKSDAPLEVALARLGVDAFRWKARRWFARQAVEHAMS